MAKQVLDLSKYIHFKLSGLLNEIKQRIYIELKESRIVKKIVTNHIVRFNEIRCDSGRLDAVHLITSSTRVETQ